MIMKTIQWSELTEEQRENFVSENNEYLVWADGSEITADQLFNFFLQETESGWNLTYNKEDYYISDVIF
jgi:hypothetical protein